jgi:hypothetical protein
MCAKEGGMLIKRLGEMIGAEPNPERIPGLLDQGLVLLVAPEGTGKTFLAIHMGVHIATGARWRGQAVDEGGVLYCIAEGVSFFPYRVTTACDAVKKPAVDAPFYIFDESLNLRTDEKGKLSPDVERLCDTVAMIEGRDGIRTKLIVFDTLNRFMPGGDENNQAECGGLVNGCEYLKKELGATILLIHHTRKDGKAVRGNTVLSGAADQILVCNKPDGTLLDAPVLWTTREFGKRKDRDPIDQWFRFEKIAMSRGTLWMTTEYMEELGMRIEEQYITIRKPVYYDTGEVEYVDTGTVQETLVMRPCDEPSEPDRYGWLVELLKKYGPMGVTQIMTKTNKGQKTVYAATNSLIEDRIIEKDAETKKYRYIDPDETPF